MSDNKPAPDPECRTVEFRGGGFAPKTVRWVGLGVFIVLITLAEAGTRMGVISALTLPRPSQVSATLADLYHSGMLRTVSYTHLTLPTTLNSCRSRWSPYH